MTTETVLTEEQIQQAVQCITAEQSIVDGSVVLSNVNMCFRELEQAVLQSPEVQALRKDAKRWEAMRQCFIGVEYDSSTEGVALFTCHIPQYQYRSGDPNKIADAAMEKQL